MIHSGISSNAFILSIAAFLFVFYWLYVWHFPVVRSQNEFSQFSTVISR